MTDQPDNTISKANLARRLAHGWDDIQAFIGSFSTEQLTQPTDAGGWTVKDHIIHLAAWEDGLTALLKGGTQRDGMNIDEATWKAGHDATNAVIQKRFRDLTLDEVLAAFRQSHERLLKAVEPLSDADLTRPYNHFDKTATSKPEDFIIWTIVGNTFGHFEDHKPWMAAIAAKVS